MSLPVFQGPAQGYKWRDGKGKKLTKSQENALKKCQDIFSQAFTGRENHLGRMKLNEKLYNNQTAKNTKTTSDVKIALTLSNIETTMAPLSDHYPEISFAPKNMNDMVWDDFINARLRQLVVDSKLRQNGIEQSKQSKIYRDGYLRIVPIFNTLKDIPKNFDELSDSQKIKYQTLAGLDVDVQDPFTVFHDSIGSGLELGKNCRYFIIAEPVPRSQVADMYDIKEKDVVSMGFDWEDYKANAGDKTQNITDMPTDDFTLLIKCYWMSDGEKYQYGRKTVYIDNQLFEDEKIEIPFTPYFLEKNLSLETRAHGISDSEITASAVFINNSFNSHIVDNLTTFGKPKEAMTERLYNQLQSGARDPGIIISDRPADDYRLISNDPVPPSMFGFLSTTMEMHEKVSGIHEALEGKRPAGVTSAIGIEALREAAVSRVREKIKHDVMPMLEKVGEYILYLIQNYDQEAIQIRERNNYDTGFDFIKYDPKAKLNPQQNAQLRKEKAEGITENDKVTLQDTEFDIVLELGRGFDKGSVAAELRSKELHNEGIIPYEMMISEMRFSPDRKQYLIKWWQDKQTVISMIGQFKEIADSMAAEGIKNAEDWVKSTELKTLQGLIEQLQKTDEKDLLQIRF